MSLSRLAGNRYASARVMVDAQNSLSELARPLRIGHIQLPTNLFLAPIAGYTDLSFRLVARELGGIGLAFTDLLCPQGVIRQNFRTQVLMQTCEEDRPLGMQLFGGDADPLVEATRMCCDFGAAVVDINMGCPVEKITGRNGGSALLCDPGRTLKMASKIVNAARGTPVTAKLRLGWDDTSIVAPQLARQLEEVGVQLITIHGRTREMGFAGNARLDGIGEVVSAVKSISVIGNGDVRCVKDAINMMRATGCAGVMIGRAALSMPWIFRDIWQYLTTGEIPCEPTLEQKCAIMTKHFELHMKHRGEWPAVCEFRQRVTWYTKTMHPCRMLKDDMRQITCAADFHRAVARFLEWRASSLAIDGG